MTMTKEERAVARERWRVLIEEFGRGDQTVDSFCAERGVKYYSFKYWQKIIKRESEPSAAEGLEQRAKFREVPVVSSSANAAAYTVVLRSGRTVLFGASFSEGSLRKLISLLESC
jgi:hypothetical protein